MDKLQPNLSLAPLHFGQGRSLEDDLLIAVVVGQSAARNPVARRLLVGGMDGVGVAGIDSDCEAGVGHGLRNYGL